ncbi:PROK1 [Branchiostoma lanceolatum]|uniref:PROK1 protein n=1 Tax=Branchiostoma lanceolatum TaxID=7740 RepID=A0A8K0F390_BRALA|nr:PROK1 [Branchiostoma lanceolatum]
MVGTEVLLMTVLTASLLPVEALVLTRSCETDLDCVVAGVGGCCARWNPYLNLKACKPLGRRGERCHIATNHIPYPFNGKRKYWRCPCEISLSCVAGGTSPVGFCQAPLSGEGATYAEKHGHSVTAPWEGGTDMVKLVETKRKTGKNRGVLMDKNDYTDLHEYFEDHASSHDADYIV